MIQRILFTTALVILFSAPAVYGQQGPDKAQQEAARARGVEAGAQASVDDLKQGNELKIQQMLDAEYQLALLEYRQEKTRRYIAHAKQRIEDLEHKKEEFRKLQVELKPYLKEVILRLENFVAQDLPFLPAERSKRIAGLNRSMGDLDLTLAELLRQVFEVGLMIETEYGRMLDTSENTTLEIDGVDTQVVILRLGRVGMYYMSLDETKTGFYNRVTGKWESLPKRMNREIKLSVEIGRNEKVAEIVKLPLPDIGAGR